MTDYEHVWEYECRGCGTIQHAGRRCVCRCGLSDWIRRYTDEYYAHAESEGLFPDF